jgi:hypothetical protein
VVLQTEIGPGCLRDMPTLNSSGDLGFYGAIQFPQHFAGSGIHRQNLSSRNLLIGRHEVMVFPRNVAGYVSGRDASSREKADRQIV